MGGPTGASYLIYGSTMPSIAQVIAFYRGCVAQTASASSKTTTTTTTSSKKKKKKVDAPARHPKLVAFEAMLVRDKKIAATKAAQKAHAEALALLEEERKRVAKEFAIPAADRNADRKIENVLVTFDDGTPDIDFDFGDPEWAEHVEGYLDEKTRSWVEEALGDLPPEIFKMIKPVLDYKGAEYGDSLFLLNVRALRMSLDGTGEGGGNVVTPISKQDVDHPYEDIAKYAFAVIGSKMGIEIPVPGFGIHTEVWET